MNRDQKQTYLDGASDIAEYLFAKIEPVDDEKKIKDIVLEVLTNCAEAKRQESFERMKSLRLLITREEIEVVR